MSILNDKQSFCIVYGFSHSKEIRVNYSIWVVIKLRYSQDKKHFTLNKSRYREHVKSYFTLAKVFFSSYNKRGKKSDFLWGIVAQVFGFCAPKQYSSIEPQRLSMGESDQYYVHI